MIESPVAPSLIDALRRLTLQPHGVEPAYKQLARGLAEEIRHGRVAPGDPLPARRPLADLLGINVHTVEHAYNLLARLGLVVTGGKGTRTVVAETGGPSAARLLTEQSDPEPAGQRLLARVQSVADGPQGVLVSLRIVEGQALRLHTSQSILNSLQLAPGSLAEIELDDHAAALAASLCIVPPPGGAAANPDPQARAIP